jgi:ribose/xylose/arabinose/galactoside ABC-type transport system permease subunit
MPPEPGSIEAPAAPATGRARPARPIAALLSSPRVLVRIAVVALLLAAAVSTPGLLARPTMVSFLTSISFVGCVAVGMTLITISGNIMSFSLGATVASSAAIYIAAANAGGVAAGIACALAGGALISGLQGAIIGFLRANAIIISIATAVFIYGIVQPLTAGTSSLYATAPIPDRILNASLLGVPIEFVVLLAAMVVGQFLLAMTAFGRRLYMVGDSADAARAAGIAVGGTVTAAYLWAGLFSSLAGAMLAMRYSRATMEFGLGFDYSAIAAVLVGGTSIAGGQGNLVRTFAGVVVVGLVELVLLLHGFRKEWQYLITGIIVLAVIMVGGGRRQ